MWLLSSFSYKIEIARHPMTFIALTPSHQNAFQEAQQQEQDQEAAEEGYQAI